MTDQNEGEFSYEADEFSEKEFLIEAADDSRGSGTGPVGNDVEEYEVGIDEDLIEELPRKNPLTRILLLLLVLVVAAGGYFYLTATEKPSQEVRVQTQKQPIVKPARQPAPTVTTAPAAPTIADRIEPASVASKPEQPPAPVTAAAQAKPAMPANLVEPVVPPATPKTEVSQGPVTAAVAPVGDFSVLAGAYLQQSNLLNAELAASRIGYPYRVVVARKPMAMTRLRYGIFSPAVAKAKLAELKGFASSAFKINDGEQVAVYAGSYASLDKARRFADLLSQKGVGLEEVAAEVPVPLYQLKLGPFADREAAEQAAQAASAAGLPVLVMAKPVR
jgi:SPOR domain